MRLQKIFLLLFILVSFAVSQKKNAAIRFLRTDPGPCMSCPVYVNGVSENSTRPNGVYELSYDSTVVKDYTIEVVDEELMFSKKFTVTLGKNKNKLPGDFVFFTILNAYLTPEHVKGNYVEALNNFKEAGVSDVIIPVFFDGATIYPSKVAGIKSSERDYLKEILAECKKLKMRAHASISTLNWGSSKSSTLKSKEYLMVNQKGEYSKGEESDLMFVSPAHPEVIRILTEINREIAIEYRDLYGINYDYIRFKRGSYLKAEEEDFGYEKNSVNLFKESNKIDPYKIKFDTTRDSQWLKWITYKENLVLNLLVKMVAAVKDTNKTLQISMNLDPNYLFEHSYNLTCANAFDIETFVTPDNYFIEFSKKDLKNELAVLNVYIPSDNPFARDEIMSGRKDAFIPLIRNNGDLSTKDLNKFIDIFTKKGKEANFSIFNYSVFTDKNNRKILNEIMFR